jgi:hypothetical protein
MLLVQKSCVLNRFAIHQDREITEMYLYFIQFTAKLHIHDVHY